LTRISSGLVIAGAYADKLRRVMFAMAKGKASPKEIVRATGVLNSTLFEVFREVGVDKGDVVRITIEFEIVNGTIEWKWDALEIQHYRPVPETQEKAKEILKKILEKAKAPPPLELKVEFHTSRDTEDVYVVKVKVDEKYSISGVVGVEFIGKVGKARAIVISPEGRALSHTFEVKYDPNPYKVASDIESILTKAYREGEMKEIEKEEAKKILQELLG